MDTSIIKGTKVILLYGLNSYNSFSTISLRQAYVEISYMPHFMNTRYHSNSTLFTIIIINVNRYIYIYIILLQCKLLNNVMDNQYFDPTLWQSILWMLKKTSFASNIISINFVYLNYLCILVVFFFWVVLVKKNTFNL